MKKFFIGLLKGIGYFGIYFGMQLLVTLVYSIVGIIPIAMKYTTRYRNVFEPDIFNQYMEEVIQVVMEVAMPAVIVSGILTIGLLWLIFVCRKKKFTQEICLRKLQPVRIVPIVLMGLSLNVVTGLVLSFIPEEWMSAYEESSSLVMSGNAVLMVIGTTIMAPIIEEIIFRGLAYTRMKKGMPTAVAVLLSSALFGVAHGQWVWMLYAFVFGLVLVWVFERSKSLLGNILLHLSYNGCAMLQMLIPEDTSETVWIVTNIVSVVVAAISIFWFAKLPKAEGPAVETGTATNAKISESVADVAEVVVENTDEM